MMYSTDIDDDSDAISCCFIGNAHDFSDQALNLARAEFSSIRFHRAPSLNRLPPVVEGRAEQVHAAIFNQFLAQPMFESLDLIQENFPNATIALAYRQPMIARDLVTSTGLCLSRFPIGFLPMNHDLDRWLIVLRLLLCGEKYLPSELLGPMTTPAADVPVTQTPPVAETDALPQPSLTGRETQVLRCIAEGKQNKLIADSLGLSEHTVKLHVHHVIAKLGVNNRTEAAIWYLSRQGDGARVP